MIQISEQNLDSISREWGGGRGQGFLPLQPMHILIFFKYAKGNNFYLKFLMSLIRFLEKCPTLYFSTTVYIQLKEKVI